MRWGSAAMWQVSLAFDGGHLVLSTSAGVVHRRRLQDGLLLESSHKWGASPMAQWQATGVLHRALHMFRAPVQLAMAWRISDFAEWDRCTAALLFR